MTVLLPLSWTLQVAFSSPPVGTARLSRRVEGDWASFDEPYVAAAPMFTHKRSSSCHWQAALKKQRATSLSATPSPEGATRQRRFTLAPPPKLHRDISFCGLC